jgi:drug/metabolite transporter (DMT)-like permease
MTKITKAHTAVLGANFIFGSNYAVVKYITPSVIHPFALNVVRILVSLFLFWGLFLFKPGKVKIQRKHIPRFLLCGLTGVVINQILFIKGVSLTTPIHSALLSLATPIFITLIAAWLLREGFTLLKLVGLVLGIGGAAMLILLKDSSHSGSDVLLGDVLVLINAVSYAFYLVLVRPLMAVYSGIQVLRWIFTFGAIVILPFGMQQFIHTDWSQFTAAHWAGLVFVAVGATFLAYLLNVYGISVIGASSTGAYIYTQPVFAAVIAIVFAGEHFSMIKLMAAILIFMGVYLANMKKSDIQSLG